jgi:hypothetical protein
MAEANPDPEAAFVLVADTTIHLPETKEGIALEMAKVDNNSLSLFFQLLHSIILPDC